MIEYIKGELTELSPALATVEAAGVGYGLNISLTTYSAIQGKKDVKLYVYEAIREDAYVLYGFVSKKEREMFELLILVMRLLLYMRLSTISRSRGWLISESLFVSQYSP